MLNALLSADIFRGVPTGRSVSFEGFKGCGKTFLSLCIAKNAQDMGYVVVWLDSENAFDVEQSKSFGIDPKKFLHQPVVTVSDVNSFMLNIVEKCLKEKEAKNPQKILFV
jgi:RecA/RadA recombinase